MSSSEFILNNFSVLHEPLFYVYTFVLSLKPLSLTHIIVVRFLFQIIIFQFIFQFLKRIWFNNLSVNYKFRVLCNQF